MIFTGIGIAFDNKKVLTGNSFNFEYSKNYCIMGPSGCGKTTLLKVILGLIKPDDGYIKGDFVGEDGTVRDIRMSAVFQNDRLIEAADPVVNVMAAAGVSKDDAVNALCAIMEEDTLHVKTSALSGGQRRRVAIIRALLAKSDILILDEPFAGLDDDTKKRTVEFIRKNQRGRTIVMSSHDEEDAELFDAKIIRL